MLSQERAFIATRDQNAILVFSDGAFWLGQNLGVVGQTRGEICFNVSMTGYQEIMTDPSYAGQIINFTFPHIGNVGCNDNDEEADSVFVKGLIVRESISEASNFRSTSSFYHWLEKRGIIGISGVDTRAITKNIKKWGPRVALIHCAQDGEQVSIDGLVNSLQDEPTLLGQDLTSQVSTENSYEWKEDLFQRGQIPYAVNKEGTLHVIVIDYGIKRNILRSLINLNFKVTVVLSSSSFDEILELNPDGILLSNGPGDPLATFANVKQTIKKILDINMPVFGICLGNQLLALASGLETLKMHRGHRGSNHPVKNLKTGQVEITSQNHGFCVSDKDIPDHVEVTHKSLFDNSIEGIRRKDKLAFSVQYHPESSPGPHDSHYLFKDFYQMVKDSKKRILSRTKKLNLIK